MNLKIIKVGDLLLEVTEEPDMQVYMKKLKFGGTGGSTVTLIRGEKTLLVDTGFEGEGDPSGINEKRNYEKLKMLLRLEGLAPENIDCVFFTHLHFDHVGNYPLFEKATFFMSSYEYERCDIPKSEPLADHDEIMEDVSVLYTPGHTKGHASVKVKAGDTVVIAGDAIVSLTYLLKGKFWCYNSDYYSHEASAESVRKIVSTADFIIPGHGSVFKSVKI